jgi:hypothetical protein
MMGEVLWLRRPRDALNVEDLTSLTDAKDPKLALFELYLATAEKVSDRRAQANAWMLSVNSAIVALYGYLQADKMSVGAAQKAVWLWAIPAAGAIVCMAWGALLTSYRKLNRASSLSSCRSRPTCR